MEYRQLGRAGLRVSALSLGAMTFGESQTFMKGVTSSDEEAFQVLDRALDVGINLVDTADIYSEGRSEELIGRWFTPEKRRRVVLATKCRFPMSGGPNDVGLSRKHIVESCEASLRRLHTDVIDLYQVHMQDRSVPIEETLRALDDLVSSGKVQYVGCSNFAAYRLVEALWAADRRDTVRFDSMQLQWNLITRDAEREVIPACRAFGVGLLVWSPLSRGFLSGKYRRGQPPPEGSRLSAWQDSWRSIDKPRNWDVLDAVLAIARQRDTSPASVALGWLLARPETSSIIVGARTIAQLDENLKAADVKLSSDEIAKLDEVSKLDWGYPYNFIAMREPW